MRVKEIMSKNVTIINENCHVSEAAKLMKTQGIGSIPVEGQNRLVGMLTDRDIALRVVAEERNTKDTTVKECMSPGVKYCYEDDTIKNLADNMGSIGHKQLPVLSKRKQLVGLVSVGDLVQRTQNGAITQNILQEIYS